MGAVQSSALPEVVVVGALVAGSVTAYGLYVRNAKAGAGEPQPSGAAPDAKNAKKKKNKARAGAGDAEFEKILAAANKENQAAAAAAASQVRVVPFPDVVPGAFEEGAGGSDGKEKKSRKRKAKKGGAASSAAALDKMPDPASPEAPAARSAGPAPADPARPASKKVKRRKTAKDESTAGAGGSKAGAPASAASGSNLGSAAAPTAAKGSAGPSISASQTLGVSLTLSDAPDDASWTRVSTRKRAEPGSATEPELLTSDTNFTTSMTDPDYTEEDEGSAQKSDIRKTFAERMLPRPRKTGVEDMEEEPLQATLARVIRVKPTSDEKPAKGFSWADYEEYAQADDGTSADGDADDVWEEVKSKRRKTYRTSSALTSSADSLPAAQRSSTAPETLTKRQRQNVERREAAKADKQAQEQERLDRLARHKHELERTRIAEQYASGKMQASVESGKLVWD